MVIQEHDEVLRRAVEIVGCQIEVEVIQTPVPGGGLFQGLLPGLVHHKIRSPVQRGVAVQEVLLRMLVVHPALRKNEEVRIDGMDSGGPLVQEVLVGIDPRVHTERVHADGLNPPKGILEQVLRTMAVPLVHIHHGRYKPSVRELLLVAWCRIRVVKRGIAMVGDRGLTYFAVFIRFWTAGPSIDPIGIGGILVKTMRRPNVVGDHVHDQLHVFGMEGLRVGFVRTVSPKARIYAVVVRDGIAVVGSTRHVVDQNRHGPNGRRPQRSDVIQVGRQAFEVTSVAMVAFAAIEGLLLQFTHLIVRQVAVGKSVGCDQVDEVPRIQAHVAASGGVARL